VAEPTPTNCNPHLKAIPFNPTLTSRGNGKLKYIQQKPVALGQNLRNGDLPSYDANISF